MENLEILKLGDSLNILWCIKFMEVVASCKTSLDPQKFLQQNEQHIFITYE